MKLIASFVSLTLVAALSAWLYLGQDATDVETAGVQIGTDSTAQTQSGPTHPGDPIASGVASFSDDYAAAFVGLQAVLDVWHTQPREVLLANPDALNEKFVEARANAETEIAALEKKAKEEAAAKKAKEEAAAKKAKEEAAAKKKAEEEAAAERARQEAAQPPRAVSPPPVSPPPASPPGADCEWDDGEWDCDDDWDDDDDDWDDDDDDDDDDWDDD